MAGVTTPAGEGHRLQAELAPHRLRRRAVPVLVGLTVLVLVALLAPGLGDVRHHLRDASPGWLAVALALERPRARPTC